MNFKDNPEYELAFTLKRGEQKPILFYKVKSAGEYHISRMVAASAQNIYSASGITSDMLNSVMDHIIKMCNSKDIITTIKTDIAMLANQVKYRTKYPVDQDCAIRMGAIYTFMEGEDPNKVVNLWTERKLTLALEHPELYAFFLHLGLASTPSYRELLAVLNDTEYFRNREITIHSLNQIVSQQK